MPRPLTTSRVVNMSKNGANSPVAGLLLKETLPGAAKEVCPAIHSVHQGDLNIKYLPASASQVQGLKACATTAQLDSFFFFFLIFLLWLCTL